MCLGMCLLGIHAQSPSWLDKGQGIAAWLFWAGGEGAPGAENLLLFVSGELGKKNSLGLEAFGSCNPLKHRSIENLL